MFKKLRDIIFAQELADLKNQQLEIEMTVNQRVADYLSKMDPFEPLLRKYNVVFSQEYENPEDKLDQQSQFQLFSWASAQEADPSYKYLVNWIRDTQGNATLRKGTQEGHYVYGRAAVATITLLVREIGRLASRYKDIMAKNRGDYDSSLPVE